MFERVQMRTIVVFLSGVAVGVAGIVFLGSGGAQTTAAAQAADQKATAQVDQKEAPQVGSYQAFKLDVPNSFAALLDTATGRLWALQEFSDNPKWRWLPLADGPK